MCLRYSFGASPKTFGNYTSGRIHRVRVSNLLPDKSYAYRLPGDPTDRKRAFRTLPSLSPPPPGIADTRYPLVFGVIGDLGQTADSEETVRHLDNEKDIRLLLHAGDLSYADSNAARWDSYGLKVEPVSSRLQWMVCPGNHEIESDFYTGQNFVPYEARVAMPAIRPAESRPSPEQVGCEHPWPWRDHDIDCTPSIFTGSYDWGNSFYAFNAGPARLFSLNSYTDTSPGSAQYTWLKGELQALRERRAATPWVIVMMHCPWYTSNADHHGERQAVMMRDDHGFEELFQEHNVSIVISGHVHAYERSHPVYRNSSGPGVRGPTYIVVGDGGNREGHASRYIPGVPPTWSAFRNGTAFGHGRLTLVNETHMLWEWMKNDATRAPALEAGEALARAESHARAGASIAAEPRSQWHLPLLARSVDDAVLIVNPYVAAVAPQPHGPGDGPGPSGWKAVAAVCGATAGAAALVAVLAVVWRRRRNRERLLA